VPAVANRPAVTTFLFTDIESSSRLWDEQPERMKAALLHHDRILREAVVRHRGVVVKTTGDGLHAAFQDPRDAVASTVDLQIALEDAASTDLLALRVRCGMHAGVIEGRDGDYFGSAVNRAARIMGAAHGGQVLVSQAVADLIRDRLPEGVALRDLGAVRLRDLSGAERVYQVEHARLRADFPALRSLEVVPNNLPQQVTTFIGREREQEQVKAALRKARLLTLCGIGGMGKTRLSLQIAADLLGDYPDGVWFIELAPITDSRLVPQAVALVLGVKEEAGVPLSEGLAAYVRDRRVLLVLDNCEHLVDACAELAKQLLQAGPHVRILASSREPFNISGETIFTVPPLSLPGQKGDASADSNMQFEAVHLFVERATAVQSSFKHTDQYMPAIVEICQRLDGIPLALELAAARVRALSVEQIAARVNDRFRLLTAGDRTAQPRQQTLRAMIDWSYDLLTDMERILFRRLAVFVGGWTLEAAESVTPWGDVDESLVLDLLADLVDKSLVVIDAEGGRYGLLETVRQYADERLAQAGEADIARSRHLAYYVSFAEIARPQVDGPEQATWLTRIDLERENLLAAHAWCDQEPDGAALGLRLVHAVHHYWFIRGLLGLGHRVTLAALARPGTKVRTLQRSQGLFEAGQLCCFMGDYEGAKALLEESLEIARELDDRFRIAKALQPLAMTASGLGDLAAARRYVEEAVELARALGDKHELGIAINGLAQLHRIEGRMDLAEPLYEQAIALESGDRENVGIGLLNLAMVWIGRDAGERARGALTEAIAIALEMGSKPVGQGALDVATGLAAWQGEHERAARWFGSAQAQMAKTGLHRDPIDMAFLTPLVERCRAALGSATFAAAEREGAVLRYDESIEEARAWLAPATAVPAISSASRDP
jgi:predicted ATPase/class 3 adenylate cyclase